MNAFRHHRSGMGVDSEGRSAADHAMPQTVRDGTIVPEVLMTNLFTNQEATFTLTAADDANNPKPAGFSAQVSGYPGAYVALVGTDNVHFVAQVAGDYTVTISGHSQDGTALPDLALSFHVSDPPVPQATHFAATAPVVTDQNITTPANPGTDTITGSV